MTYNDYIKEGTKRNLDYWATNDGLILLTGWARAGLHYQDIANNMGIHLSQLTALRQKHQEIDHALEQGKEIVDFMVENALLKRCLGYEYEEVKTVVTPTKDGKRSIARVERIKKHVAPDTTAMAIWLNNRKPDEWKRNRDQQLYITEDDGGITINLVKASDAAKKSSKKSEQTAQPQQKSATTDKVTGTTTGKPVKGK